MHANGTQNVNSQARATDMVTRVFRVARCRCTVVGGDKVAGFGATLVSADMA